MELRERITLGLEGLTVHRLRTVLTSLGIIFGVAAVIAMMAIGEGAKQEALRKFQALGVNNIIVRDRKLTDQELEEARAKFSAGLSLRDLEAIRQIVPTIDDAAAQAELEIEAQASDR